MSAPRKKSNEASTALIFWLGIGFVGFGTFLAWAVLTAPEGPPRELLSATPMQRLARMVPYDIASRFTLGFAGLSSLFGLLLICGAIADLFRRWTRRRN
ncbi:hypothetical protein [Prosthecobacter sp.]|uniref:hypothetical protein n=1 Tax=Prosthecobacter sp. TaxID=1965333 RepID=UPI001D4D9001|nr:hypothetical protein [Prosthecobacter sp.]MCB1275485.1 hypothetical protein [Prosthecobacter sp.]